jgi:hypothetical protein
MQFGSQPVAFLPKAGRLPYGSRRAKQNGQTTAFKRIWTQLFSVVQNVSHPGPAIGA